MTDERGSITLWMVGLVMVVFLVGGMGLDLWRGLSAHRRVAAVVDAAAVAAGSGIDPATWRSEGRLVLSPLEVEQRVAQTVAAQTGSEDITVAVSTNPDGSAASVTGVTWVDLSLLGLVTDGALEVSATATASPILSP